MRKKVIFLLSISIFAFASFFAFLVFKRNFSSIPSAMFDTFQSSAAAPEKGILNILLIGVDSIDTTGTTSGTMPHADMIMLAAVNFDTNKIDIVSIPRDTFTEAGEEHRGYYKLGCIFNVGGGIQNPEAGVDYLRRTVEKTVGVPVPYYCAVTFDAIIQLIDSVGGIDYELDIPITSFDGTYYKPGWQHLDGSAAAKYLKTRDDTGFSGDSDVARTDRQRRFLVALFKKMKNEARLSVVPELISSIKDGFWTNANLSQIAALAEYAKDINTRDIRLHSVAGQYAKNYNFKYFFVDQSFRQKYIRTIYGMEAEPLRYCSTYYENFLADCGAVDLHWIAEAKKVLDYADETVQGYGECKTAYSSLLELHTAMSDLIEEHFEFFDDATVSEYSALRDRLFAAGTKLRNATEALAESCCYPAQLNWSTSNEYWLDANVNDVYVDFN